ncbi:MAG: alpha/beta fold hydrolase [Myxococcales bacterium]|nr:alpha/beta fold hydrolase [Myxococcales bacterium]
MAKQAVGDVELDYERFGPEAGRPLVLIRGLGTQRTQWPEDFLQALVSEGHHVVTFDNRDVGLSTRFEAAGAPDIPGLMMKAAAGETPEVPYHVTDMAADVAGLIEALGLGSAHVAGISMGGMIAQQLACSHPERVISLASIMSSSGAPGLPGPTPEASAALMAEPDPPGDREAVARTSLAGAKVWGSLEHWPGDDWVLDQARQAFDRSYDPVGVARQLAAVVAAGSRADALAKLSVPTLVIHGDADTLIPPEGGKDTAARIPGAELLIVPGMGHDIVPALIPTLVTALSDHTRSAG